MASTIGTNVVMDEQDVAQFLDRILGALDTLLRDKDREMYSRMIKNLGEYVGNNGKLSYSVVDSKFTKEIEEYLQSERIDYMLLPTQNGMGIAVKDCDADRFKDIQEKVMKYSVDNTHQLSNAKEFLEDIKYNPKTRNMDIPVLSFSNNTARLIVQEQMVKMGIVPCFDDRNNKVYARPDAVFSNNGDLVDALYKSGFDLARMSISDDYSDTKMAQIKYDRDTLNEFINDAKNGKPSFLVDRANTSKSMLSVDATGNILLIEGKKTKVLMTDQEVKESSSTDIFSHLSRHSKDIYNMTVCKNLTGLEAIVNPGKYPKDALDIVEQNCSGSRPEYKSELAKGLSFASKDIELAMKSISAQANREIASNPAYKHLSAQKLFMIKKNLIAEIIQTRNNDTLRDFMNKDIKGLSLADKETILKNTLDITDEILGNSGNDFKLEFVKQKQLDAELAKAHGLDKEADKETPQPEV